MPSARRLVVAGAIVDDLHRPTRLLAGRRSAPKSLAGQWEFAGGKVEPGEDPQAALHRELAEELGVRVQLGEPILPAQGVEWPILHGHAMRIWFAQIVTGQPEPLADHDELRWLPVADLYQVPWLEPDLPIVDAVSALVGEAA
ncbi:MAG TPA: (deoxy)nucleoside triphosphate pyrophosphohydrolase [Candidatus Ruania gallistercoris]|uniref:8-oxo-dGTP diphosphatase n=1 Tax=Candidatus Ruania gallistercoris TaxID=2838746 RepID=A0A9D2EIC6_9MICO|nr:(deoxy)nucleoside triphosphate pyrophosphohydrolase [Candidatus Ruania gallistercoris]